MTRGLARAYEDALRPPGDRVPIRAAITRAKTRCNRDVRLTEADIACTKVAAHSLRYHRATPAEVLTTLVRVARCDPFDG